MMDESFYITQYWSLKDMLFISIESDGKVDDEVNQKLMEDYGKLKHFNCFVDHRGGSILHQATFDEMVYYCTLLLKDDFNVQQKNKYKATPLYIAKSKGYASIASKFDKKLKDKKRVE